MDRFKVSGEDLRGFYKQETDLGRVFSDIERDLSSTDQVVCQYIVNGLELCESDEKKFSQVSLREIESLEYLTENKHKLIGQVVGAWIHALPELLLSTERLAERLRGGGLVGVNKSIYDLVENCEYLVGSMVSLKAMLGEKVAGFVPSWELAEKQSHAAVQQALVAMEAKDFVQLADILEYDLNQALQTWHEGLVRWGDVFDVGYSSANEKTGSNTSGRGRLAN